MSANFRLKFSMFRARNRAARPPPSPPPTAHEGRLAPRRAGAYGVTKAELIVWLLRAGRPAVVSDVDCAWLSRPQVLFNKFFR